MMPVSNNVSRSWHPFPELVFAYVICTILFIAMVERLSALSNFSQAQQAALLDNANGTNGTSHHQMSSNGFNSGAVPSNLEELAMVNAFLVKLSEQISASANIANVNNSIPNVTGQHPTNNFRNTLPGTSRFYPF